MSDQTLYIILGAVAVAVVLHYKGYISLPLPAPPPGNTTGSSKDSLAAVESVSTSASKPLFRQAVRVAMLEAQDAAADKIAEGLRSQVVDHLSSPFASAAPATGSNPPASPASAN